jgi:hypothetical protein
LSSICPAAGDVGTAVYLVENVNTPGKGALTRNLVRITFASDGTLEKTVVLTVDQRFFGHSGGHQIVDGRFVVTKYGGVIDLQTGTVIHDMDWGDLLGVENGRIFYSASNMRHDRGYFTFDLRTGTESKLLAPGKWGMPGLRSPDQTMSIRQEYRKTGNALGPGGVTLLEMMSLTNPYLDVLPPAGLFGSGSSRPTKELGDGEYKFELSRASADAFMPNRSQHPFLWLDNQQILTQRRNGELLVLNVDGSTHDLVEIPVAKQEPPLSAPRLIRDPDGRIIYTIGIWHETGEMRGDKKLRESVSTDFIIDVATRVATPTSRRSLGFGFAISLTEDAEGVRTIYKDDAEIGQWKCVPYQIAAAPGLIAVLYRDPAARYGDLKGVAIWSKTEGIWQTVSMWPNDLIGWVTTESSK